MKSMMMAPARKEPDKETYSGRFALHFKKLREKAGLNALEFADSIGVAISTVYSWENASRAPNIGDLPKIAKALNLKKTRDLLPNE